MSALFFTAGGQIITVSVPAREVTPQIQRAAKKMLSEEMRVSSEEISFQHWRPTSVADGQCTYALT